MYEALEDEEVIMSDDPRKLKAMLLEQATTEQQKAFAKMLAEQCAEVEAREGHKCWFFVPTASEWERMKRFSEGPAYDRCPNCKKGRVVVEVYHGNFGSSWHLVCRWGVEGCDFKEYISDDE